MCGKEITMLLEISIKSLEKYFTKRMHYKLETLYDNCKESMRIMLCKCKLSAQKKRNNTTSFIFPILIQASCSIRSSAPLLAYHCNYYFIHLCHAISILN